MASARAAFLTAPNTFEMRTLPIPAVHEDDAVIRIEAAGLCGSEIEQVRSGGRNPSVAIVPGHEPLGVIESIGSRAAERWGVEVGDRVCLEVVIPCRECARCASGVFSSCERSLGAYGYRPFEAPTQLIGGFAEYMYLHPNSVVHKISRDVPVEIASMFNTLAAGIRWAVQLGGVQLGDTVAILGAGQRGIAAAMASKAAGAETVIITGLTRDAHKLKLSKEFGADHTIVADVENVPECIREITDGRLADIVLDLTPMAAQPVQDALDSVRFGGTVVLAGLKGHRPIELITDRIIQKGLRILGAHGVESTSVEAAIRLMESGSYSLEKLHTHSFDLDSVLEAISVLAGEVEGELAIHVALIPN